MGREKVAQLTWMPQMYTRMYLTVLNIYKYKNRIPTKQNKKHIQNKVVRITNACINTLICWFTYQYFRQIRILCRYRVNLLHTLNFVRFNMKLVKHILCDTSWNVIYLKSLSFHEYLLQFSGKVL